MPKMPAKVKHQRDEIVTSFVNNLETKGLPFVQEWASGTLPFNPLTGNTYRGVNRVNLRSIASMRHVTDPRWLTWQQIQKAGYRVRKGARSAAVEKWKAFEFERAIEGSDETQKCRGLNCVGYYNVFNCSDVQGMPEWQPQTQEMPQTAVMDIADRLIASSRCPVIEDDEARAYYRPSEDIVHMPSRGLFLGSTDTRAQHFVRVLAHEMTHSTALPLQRDTTAYDYEELVAELGAVLLTNALGLAIALDVSDPYFTQHAAYLNSWVSNLKDKPNALWGASAQADRATGYLLENYRNGGADDTADA